MMINFKQILLIAIFYTVAFNANAQQGVFQPGDYRDGIYDKENSTNRRFIPYTHLREADVNWEKRVWRRLDMREKQNHQLYYPITAVTSRISLMQVISKYVLSGQIIAFKDEEFLEPLELGFIRDKMVIREDSAEVEEYDKDGNAFFVKKPGAVDSTWTFEFFSSLELKEDWFFDKQKSVLEVRILAMGFNVINPKKPDLGEFNLFYTYFPACRPFFAKHEVYNAKNDSERRTFEDIFWKRQFSSTAIKETNVYDRSIERYSKGIDALLESDRIKNDIFRWEHDLWHF
ncbi:MAG: gliding motility associated protein GldN [Bacteroidota bacterium]|nr:gliding motility associated protein GldN [Bacteroidota bacterium]